MPDDDTSAAFPLEHTQRLLPLPATSAWPDGIWDTEVLRRGDVSLSLFTPRGADHQSVHEQDEVYLVIAGTGLLRSGDLEHAFVPGDALYVAAGQEHRFVGDLTGLVMWVVFWTCRPAGDPGRREEHSR